MAVSRKLKKKFKDEPQKSSQSQYYTAIKVILILVVIALIPFVFLNPDVSLGPFDFLRKGFFVSEIKMTGHKYDVSGLVRAIDKKEERTVKLFVRSDFNLTKYSTNGDTPLCLAARTGDLELIKIMLSGNANISQRNFSDSLTPICCAVQGGNIKVIETFINKGINVNTRIEYANAITPLHIAAQDGNDEVISYLLSKGADVNAVDFDGRTPLHYACKQDKVSVLYLLLNAGANAQMEDLKGVSSLDIAEEAKNTTFVEVLKQNGAVEKQAKEDETKKPKKVPVEREGFEIID